MRLTLLQGMRGWGWLGWIAGVELALLALQAVPGFVQAPAAVSPSQTATSQTATAQVPVRIDLQPILDFQPFGAAATPNASAHAADPGPAPAALILQGVMWRGDPATSRALVRSDSGPARIYATGDRLPGGGTLLGIEVDRIWLDLDGQKRILRFPDPATAPRAQATEAAGDTAQTGDSSVTTSHPTANSTPPSGKAKALPHLDLKHLIPGLVANPAAQP